jgi:hypothetical protein
MKAEEDNDIIETERTSFRESRDLSQPHRRCCFCLSLQRGISIIILGDLFFLLIVFSALYYQFYLQLVYHDEYFLKEAELSVFFFCTVGILSFLLFLKVYFGMKFLFYSTRGY